MADRTRRYRIRITDVGTRKDLLVTVADWTDEERHVAVTQIGRLAGVPIEVVELFAEEVAPKPKSRRRKQ